MRNRQIAELKDNSTKISSRVDKLMEEFKEYCNLKFYILLFNIAVIY